MNVKERNDLLIRLDERTAKLDRDMSNHLKSHLRYSIMAWTAALTAIGALIIQLLSG